MKKLEAEKDIEKFIDTIRETDFYIEIIYMNGGCYQFHLLLKSIFDCDAYITPNKGHVVSRYNDKYYDIMGEYTKEEPTRMTEEDIIMAEKWSFYRNNKLKITECPNCETPITFTEFKAGDKATLTIKGLGKGEVERLEEPKIHIKEAIKVNTIIHCKTEEEAERILEMAHELGYRWHDGDKFTYTNEWNVYGNKTCYNIFDGTYGFVKLYESNKQIIPSTQIADLESPKLTGGSLSPEDIKEIKAGEKADNRYALKRDVLTILSVESKLNPDKKISEYLEQFKLILEVL